MVAMLVMMSIFEAANYNLAQLSSVMIIRNLLETFLSKSHHLLVQFVSRSSSRKTTAKNMR